jgi:adenosylmethionine-8-amino-7-oxononanoate aminotransferase
MGELASRGLHAIHFASPYSFGNPWAVELADLLSSIAADVVGKDARVFFVNSGSEGIEAALKLARAYHRRRGQSGRYKVIARKDSYHGTTFGALSASGFTPMRSEYEPLVPGFRHVPNTLCSRCELGCSPDSCRLACAHAIARMGAFEAPDSLAAVLIEPFQNCGGNIPPPDGYLETVRNISSELGALLIVDEVICGFGRLASWFGSRRYGLQADMIVCAKGLTSGYESLGAVIVRREVADVFWGTDGEMFSHGSTFGGRPAACAAATENIAVIREERLIEATAERSMQLRQMLQSRIACLPVVGEIRGEGLLFGIDICRPDGAPLDAPELMQDVTEGLCSEGLICCMYATRCEPVLELAPPLTVTREECARIVDTLEAVLVRTLCRGESSGGAK